MTVRSIRHALLIVALAGCTSSGSPATHNGPIACSATQPCPSGMSCGFAPGCDQRSGVCQSSQLCGGLPVMLQYCGCDGQTMQRGACHPTAPYRADGPCEVTVVPESTADLLPADFSVDGAPVPTDSTFRGAPGCYVACYAHRAEGAAYSVGGDIYVHGLVRVPGRYSGRVCRPTGHEGADISVPSSPFSRQCAEVIPSCRAGCWAGGDTGGFLGYED
jgi:hypothetical protein